MSTALTGMVFNARRGRLKRTGQLTCYHVNDDGDKRRGLLEQLQVLTVGQYSLTSNIEVAHYANNGISFVAPNTVNDAGAGLVTILTGDIVVIKGATNPANNGTFNVAGGGVAGSFTTVENTIVNEGAGAYVKLYKRTAHSNNCVRDLRTGLMWSRTTSNAEKVGEASTGLLIWADVTKVYPIYAAANTISMILPNIFRITGGAALTQFDIGDLIDLAGFATAANNLPGFYVTAVTVNGADLDITIDPSNQVLVAEGAVGDSIGLVCRSIYNYAAGANQAPGLGGYSDWQIPNIRELGSIQDEEAPTAMPDAVAFPGWPAAPGTWTSTTWPSGDDRAHYGGFTCGELTYIFKTATDYAALVRLGI